MDDQESSQKPIVPRSANTETLPMTDAVEPVPHPVDMPAEAVASVLR